MRKRLISALVAAVVAIPGTALVAAPASAAPVGAEAKGFSSKRFVKGRTDLTLDAAAADALASLGVKVTPFLAGSRDGRTSFPVVGNPKDGTIEHIGGLALSAGKRWVLLSNYTIDLNRGVLTGLVNFGQRAPLFTLGAPTANGVTLALTAPAATVLNSTFGVTAFTEGLVIGYGNPVLH